MPVQVDTWGPFVFVNPDPDAPPLAEHLGELPDLLAAAGLDLTLAPLPPALDLGVRGELEGVLRELPRVLPLPDRPSGLLEGRRRLGRCVPARAERDLLDAVRAGAASSGKATSIRAGRSSAASSTSSGRTSTINVMPGQPNLSIGPVVPPCAGAHRAASSITSSARRRRRLDRRHARVRRPGRRGGHRPCRAVCRRGIRSGARARPAAAGPSACSRIFRIRWSPRSPRTHHPVSRLSHFWRHTEHGHDRCIAQDIASRLLNRELSTLEYNEGPRPRRRRFSSTPRAGEDVPVVSSNLDEFFMVGWRADGSGSSGLAVRSADGLTPRSTLTLIRERVLELTERQAKLWRKVLRPALADEGIVITQIDDLDPDEVAELDDRFQREIFPVLTPLGSAPVSPSRTSPASHSASASSRATRSRARSDSRA